jgi:hypothetical protein
MTNTWEPRTLSDISTNTSPSLKRLTSDLPSGTSRYLQTAFASGTLEVPQNIFALSS